MKINFKYVRLALIIVLALVFAFSAFQLIRILVGYRQGASDYEDAAGMVGLPDLSDLPLPTLPGAQTTLPASPDPSATDDPGDEDPASSAPAYVDPYTEALKNMDFTALQEVNSDVLGWILIPGTVISYPIVQGEDNDYYLTHTWRNTRNSVGAIFMECKSSRDFSDFNTILYGHRMNNNSMFGVLHRFVDQSYWKSHPYVYITDENGSRRYDIFAAYEVSTSGDTYRIGFSGTQSKQSFIDFCLEQSVIDTGVIPTVQDSILTLSTCTGNGHATRWVVQAVCRYEPPVEEPEPEASEPPVQPTVTPSQPPAPSASEAPVQTPAPTRTPTPQPTQPPVQTTTPSQTPPPETTEPPAETPEAPSQEPEPSVSEPAEPEPELTEPGSEPLEPEPEPTEPEPEPAEPEPAEPQPEPTQPEPVPSEPEPSGPQPEPSEPSEDPAD